jgi:hypothetical protein
MPCCTVCSSTAATQTMAGGYMNHHPRFNIVESSLAAGVKTEVQIVLDVLVMLSPETADRKGGHLD